MTRRWLSIVMIVMLSLSVIGYGVFVYFRIKQDPHRERLILVVPVNVSGDDVPELIRLYGAPGNDYSRLEAVDLDNKVVWETRVPPVMRLTVDRRTLVTVARGSLVLATREFVPDPRSHRHRYRVTGVELKSGKRRWSFSLRSVEKWGLYLILVSDGEHLLLVSQDKIRHYISSIDPESGIVRWRAQFPRAPRGPVFHKQHLLLSNGNQLSLLRLSDGKVTVVRALGMPQIVGGRCLVQREIPHTDQTIVKELSFPDYKLQPVSKDEARWRFPRECLLAGYRRGLVVGCALKDRIHELRVIPLSPLEAPRTVRWSEEYYMPDSGYLWRDYEPRNSAFYRIRTRYLPLILWNSKTRKSGRKTLKQLLVVIDLTEGELVWRSKLFMHKDFEHAPSDWFFRDGRYLLRLNYFSKGNFYRSLMLFDGKKGRFSAVFHLDWPTAEKKSYDRYPMFFFPYMFDRYLLAGHKNNRSWIIDLRAVSFAFAWPTSLRIVDARELVERELGPLP